MSEKCQRCQGTGAIEWEEGHYRHIAACPECCPKTFTTAWGLYDWLTTPPEFRLPVGKPAEQAGEAGTV